MTYDELLRQIEEHYKKAAPAKFESIGQALLVVASGLKYLTDQCEDKKGKKDGSENKDADSGS